MARRRTNFNFNSRRLDTGEMLGMMFVLWLARVALWAAVALIGVIGIGFAVAIERRSQAGIMAMCGVVAALGFGVYLIVAQVQAERIAQHPVQIERSE